MNITIHWQICSYKIAIDYRKISMNAKSWKKVAKVSIIRKIPFVRKHNGFCRIFIHIFSVEIRLISTLPSQWFLASAILYAYQPLLQIASKEGAVIGAVLGRRKLHRGHH
jgi:hypothetical protein